MYQILEKEELAPKIKKFAIEAPQIAAKAEPGHFLIVRVDEFAERIPLTIADYDREQGSVTIIVQEVGFSSQQICELEAGDSFLDVVGPLGKPIETAGYERVICIAGGLGSAPLYPKVKSLAKEGVELITILGAQTEELLILEEDLAELSHKLYITTDDGSKGKEGFVTDQLDEILAEDDQFDLVIAIGPMIMMKFVAEVTKEYGIDTMVSLNSLMVDGTGMCGGCRVTVGGETKFSCVDGPAFDGHLVDFDEQLQRSKIYQDKEDKVKDHEFWGDGCRAKEEN
ncbi:sulfide/dihydroorotate dehydrogenase-like FAD/NAD-binding protein [Natroniella sulfidigena]|uniref:sulfide/dihydroorotate dehydrogenase-like FAD/NAD-binding protein n=1 Tax=Natroniella sulfidigena TaxID=723921 RepID=UPI00200AFDE0|nr:sulfide/dihydroorotate dehydrogenase-like FAD/NAD-binding protein [Natroniella sulfidigena]MCK8817513.1 sulfide/dihydroorotate dehydrogenase-like FAD/NAD-binding protein [Natroniella sulfidigena]